MATARVRTHKKTYADRNKLAKQRGFASYSQQRKAQEKAQTSKIWASADFTKPSMRKEETVNRISLYWKAFYTTDTKYGKDSAKAKWFVEVEKKYTYDEWQTRYPKGIREDD